MSTTTGSITSTSNHTSHRPAATLTAACGGRCASAPQHSTGRRVSVVQPTRTRFTLATGLEVGFSHPTGHLKSNQPSEPVRVSFQPVNLTQHQGCHHRPASRSQHPQLSSCDPTTIDQCSAQLINRGDLIDRCDRSTFQPSHRFSIRVAVTIARCDRRCVPNAATIRPATSDRYSTSNSSKR